MTTVVTGNLKAPFLIATTQSCRERCYSFPWIAPLYPWSTPYNAVLSNEASSTIFWVFGMTWPAIELWSPRPLASPLTIVSMGHLTVCKLYFKKSYLKQLYTKDYYNILKTISLLANYWCLRGILETILPCKQFIDIKWKCTCNLNESNFSIKWCLSLKTN